ncbi:MAG: hypothetical protein ACK4YP_23485 [Myxococcota bacterium]
MSRYQDPHEGRVTDRVERVQGTAEEQAAEQRGRAYGAPKDPDEGKRADHRTGARDDANAPADRGSEHNTVMPEAAEGSRGGTMETRPMTDAPPPSPDAETGRQPRDARDERTTAGSRDDEAE